MNLKRTMQVKAIEYMAAGQAPPYAALAELR
jgi:hypothetical protein